MPTVILTPSAGTDDGYVTGNLDTYPPTSGTAANTDATRILVGREHDTSYWTYNGLVRWDTRVIPAKAKIVSATLRLYCFDVVNTNSRQIQMEWFHTWPITTGSFAPYADNTAHVGTNLASITASADNDFPLTNLSNIRLNDYTGIRMHISGGAPTGYNHVQVGTYERGGGTSARLIITYVMPGTYHMML